MEKPVIAPSILSADFSNMAGALKEISASGAEWVHIDVMDGHFVPNLTFGPKMVKDLKPHSGAVFDVHLMVSNPGSLIEEFAKAGADYITFHLEAAVHVHRLLNTICGLGKKCGISIVPSTPLSLLDEIIRMVDLVLVMTVNPGFGGQALIPECLEKARRLAQIRKEEGLSFLISVDGGINEGTAAKIREAGVDVMVAGEAFFKAPDKKAIVSILKGQSF